MTESDWLSSRNATALLDYLFPQQNSSPVPVRVARKVRLYWCGLCRAGWYRLPPAGRAAVDYAERLADGLAYDPAVGHTVLNAVRDLMLAFDRPETVARIERDLRAVGLDVPVGRSILADKEDWSRLAGSAYLTLRSEQVSPARITGAGHIPDLVRCVFGNPFRPVAFDPGWLTRTVAELARVMVESRDFAAMPILADALEEAGCDEPAVLSHCREGAVHARGCWVVDGLLGLDRRRV